MLYPTQIASFVIPFLVERPVTAQDGFARSTVIFDYRTAGKQAMQFGRVPEKNRTRGGSLLRAPKERAPRAFASGLSGPLMGGSGEASDPAR
jgi:hypothetical protein